MPCLVAGHLGARNRPLSRSLPQAPAAGTVIKIAVLKTKYPQGSEKQLIKAVLDLEVPLGGLPADVGVAMGQKGTEAAKEAAEMVLADDNFSSIVDAVKEGRTVYDNIKKFITYILTSNVPEILPFIAYVIFPIPLPITVIQILSIDLELVQQLGDALRAVIDLKALFQEVAMSRQIGLAVARRGRRAAE